VEILKAPARSDVPFHGGEKPQLEKWLDYFRQTLLVKGDGLSVEQLRTRPLASSKLSLLGLLRHVALVEIYWFQYTFAGLDERSPYEDLDREDPDTELARVEDHSLEEVLAIYEGAVARSKEIGAAHELDELARRTWPDGRVVDLRWVYVHMIEEYARHCGHADFLREMIDGVVGD